MGKLKKETFKNSTNIYFMAYKKTLTQKLQFTLRIKIRTSRRLKTNTLQTLKVINIIIFTTTKT